MKEPEQLGHGGRGCPVFVLGIFYGMHFLLVDGDLHIGNAEVFNVLVDCLWATDQTQQDVTAVIVGIGNGFIYDLTDGNGCVCLRVFFP